MVATWLSNVNTFGFEIVFPNPNDSSAVISAFNTAEPVFFNIPIPLVAPAAPKSVMLSVAAPKPAVPEFIGPSPVLAPWTPPMILPFLL